MYILILFILFIKIVIMLIDFADLSNELYIVSFAT